MNVRPVVFRNRDGMALHGVLHEPARRRAQAPAVILLSPGVKMRVGPHRLYLRVAETLAALGVPVLRFDFSGLGDSEGEIEEESLVSVYNSILNGRFVGDTRDAMNWMQQECGVSRFVLAGLCGGAITGLLTGAEDKRVAGLLGLGIPVVFEGGQGDFARYITQGQLSRIKKRYLRKLTDAAAWLRLLSFRSNYRLIGKILKQSLVSSWPLKRTRAVKPPPEALGNLNPKFAPAFLEMVRGRRHMLLVFSGGDRLGWEFQEKFLEPNRHALTPYTRYFDVKTVDKANHVFMLREWQDEMLCHARVWFQRHYLRSAAQHRQLADVDAKAAIAPGLRNG